MSDKMNDANVNRTDYEPNFILKPAQPAQDEMEAASADAKAGVSQAANAETLSAKAEAVAAELEAMAKAADAVARKAEAAAGETFEAADEDPMKTEPAETEVQDTPSGTAAETELPAEAEPSTAGDPADDRMTYMFGQEDLERLSRIGVMDPREQDPSSRETEELFGSGKNVTDEFYRSQAQADNTADPRQVSVSGSAAAAGRPAGSSFGAAGFAGNARGGGFDPNRPKYENPSFDPGQTGRYTDPRENFRARASCSWSNGEVHRSRKQMKDSIHKQAKQKKPAQPIMLTRKGLALLVAGCLMLSCLFGLGGAALGTTLVKQNQANTAQTTTASTKTDKNAASTADYTLESATGSSMSIKEITAATQNSVVEIRTESVASDTWMQQYVTQGAGSGVIISDDGYIMTNNHVIEGANKIKVTTADEKEYDATLVGTDETNDVAVIKIDAKGLTPVTYGNSDQLEVGDMAVAIGNPLGELGGTVTAGIISATDRELTIDGKTMHLLQTDSSINPGNSGGGLFNGDGQLIGLVVAKSSGSDVEGLGFAIPVNKAADVAQQLIDKGYVSGQPSTGMTYQEGNASSGDSADPFSSFDSFFGSGSAGGVFIYSVNGENAKKAGFQSGDQVYAVDDKEITTFDDLSAVITSHKVGDKVTFTVIRGGEKLKIKLQLEEKEAAPNSGSNNQNGQTAPDEGQNSQDLPDSGTDNSQGGQGNWQDFFNSFF